MSPMDHTIHLEDNNKRLVLTGTILFFSLDNLKELLKPFLDKLEDDAFQDDLTIDISKMSFGCSSLVTVLARIIMNSQLKKIKVILLHDSAIPWQVNFIDDIKDFSDTLEIQG